MVSREQNSVWERYNIWWTPKKKNKENCETPQELHNGQGSADPRIIKIRIILVTLMKNSSNSGILYRRSQMICHNVVKGQNQDLSI